MTFVWTSLLWGEGEGRGEELMGRHELRLLHTGCVIYISYTKQFNRRRFTLDQRTFLYFLQLPRTTNLSVDDHLILPYLIYTILYYTILNLNFPSHRIKPRRNPKKQKSHYEFRRRQISHVRGYERSHTRPGGYLPPGLRTQSKSE